MTDEIILADSASAMVDKAKRLVYLTTTLHDYAKRLDRIMATDKRIKVVEVGMYLTTGAKIAVPLSKKGQDRIRELVLEILRDDLKETHDEIQKLAREF